jgi:hypothetical protein
VRRPAGIRSYPEEGAIAVGGPPMPASWRHFGHSWSDGGWDDPPFETAAGALRRTSATGIAERLAGMLHLAPAAFRNYSIAGTSLMDATNGAGYYLHNTIKPHGQNVWPWEANHGVDGFTWGVNDIGTRHITGMLTNPAAWPEQEAMWRVVWQHHWRTVIQRSIAGGIFPAERTTPSNLADPTTGYHPRLVFGGPGGGGWTFQPTDEASGTGYWRTATTGATVTFTVPDDYDTGFIALRSLVPGSYFPGATTIWGADGTGPYGGAPPNDSLPAITLGAAGSETFLAPVNLTISSAGLPSIVQDCRLLRNHRTLGIVGVNNTMWLTNRMPVPPTAGTARVVTLTVGTVPAGGFYGFDSAEIEAPIFRRRPVVIGNVAPPAWQAQIYSLGYNTWAGIAQVQADFSLDQATVAAEWGDPGICIADLRGVQVGHELEYAALWPAGLDPSSDHGSATHAVGTPPMVGDGTHPHAVGAALFAQAYIDALVRANLPAYRYAAPFDPLLAAVR